MVTNTYSVLNSFTGAADAALDNHILSITGAPAMDFRKVELYKANASAAGTPGVYTVTPNGTVTGTHNLVISQFVKALGKVVTVTLQYTATAADTATTICNAWRAQLTAFASAGLAVTASGTTTLILTTTAPNNFLNVVSSGTQAATVATTTTPGARVGNGADLLITPVGDLLGTTNFVAANTYKSYEFTYGAVQEKSTAGENALQVSKHIVFANTGGANYAAFDTQLTTLVQAIATTTLPVEGVALG